MACLYYEVQELGRRFLNGDDWEDKESSASEPLRKLRLHTLLADRVERFLSVYATEKMHLSPNQSITILQDALSRWQVGQGSLEKVSPGRLDAEAWIHILLSRALFANKKFAELAQHLEMACKIFSHTHNDRGCLWVQLYMIKFREGGVDVMQVNSLKKLAGEFEAVEDWEAVQVCMFQVAQVYQRQGNHTLYSSTLRQLFRSQVKTESR